MKRQHTLLLFILFLWTLNIFPQGIRNLIYIDSLKKYVQELSGDRSFVLNGTTSTIRTRNTAANPSDINLAAAYIKNKFESFGLSAYEQPFTFNYGNTVNAKNIYAVQTGNTYPTKKFIICAHYDSYSRTGGDAPGADDNASGTAAVIEAARVLSQRNPKYTIVYIAFSGEEQGLIGSYYYSQQASKNSEDIVGVLNLDMIAWDGNNDSMVDVEYNYTKLDNNNRQQLDKMLSMLSTANQRYGINMPISKYDNASGNSDHFPFLDKGYPAFIMIEQWQPNPYYHQATDLFSSLNYSFYDKCARLAICTLAELAQIDYALITGSDEKIKIPPGYALNQNYPNPFNPSTVISYRLAEAGNVKLKIYDAIGREVKTLVDEFQSAGEHNTQFSVTDKTLTSGVYFYTLQAGNKLFTKKMVYLR